MAKLIELDGKDSLSELNYNHFRMRSTESKHHLSAGESLHHLTEAVNWPIYNRLSGGT